MKNRREKRVWIPLFYEVGIMLFGFFAGIIPGIAIKTGVSLDASDWSIKIMKEMCRITQNEITFNCYALVSFISLAITAISVFAIWRRAVKINSIKIFKLKVPGLVMGISLYLMGFILGVFSVIKLLNYLNLRF